MRRGEIENCAKLIVFTENTRKKIKKQVSKKPKSTHDLQTGKESQRYEKRVRKRQRMYKFRQMHGIVAKVRACRWAPNVVQVKSCVACAPFVVLWWIWMLCDCINNLDTHTTHRDTKAQRERGRHTRTHTHRQAHSPSCRTSFLRKRLWKMCLVCDNARES